MGRTPYLGWLEQESDRDRQAALEAMAGGVPVIASASGGLPELIEDGIDGFLAPVGDTDEMTKKALEILTDSAKWEAMSRRAAEKVRTHFLPDHVVDRYVEVYERLLGKQV